ncbi:MAG: hypothetical protein KJO07_08110 [Deltaproteobacteria bacterium]|nr:hypothetical protein [Deltaproteobacteria bacterium]
MQRLVGLRLVEAMIPGVYQRSLKRYQRLASSGGAPELVRPGSEQVVEWLEALPADEIPGQLQRLALRVRGGREGLCALHLLLARSHDAFWLASRMTLLLEDRWRLVGIEDDPRLLLTLLDQLCKTLGHEVVFGASQTRHLLDLAGQLIAGRLCDREWVAEAASGNQPSYQGSPLVQAVRLHLLKSCLRYRRRLEVIDKRVSGSAGRAGEYRAA